MGEERESGQASGFNRAAKEALIQVEQRCVVGGRERDAELMRPSANRDAQIEWAALGNRRVPVEQLHARAVEQHFELLAADLAERGVAAHIAFIDRDDLEHVLAGGGELMTDQ